MTNEVIKAIESRRSVRKYLSKPVPHELLKQVAEAGTYAPTAKNLQSPTIIVVTKDEDLKELRKLNAEVLGTTSDPYYGAPAIILVLADSNVGPYVQDASCVLMDMMLAAHSLGLATCWINREKEMFDMEEGKALLKKWGIDPALKGVGALAIGYPDGPLPPIKPRKADYIHFVD